jgi:uncharacterized membrane protein YdbT with pleckstrin-like domain
MEDLMQNSIKPDKKYFTKVLWMLITITVLSILAVGVTHFIIYLNRGEMEVAFMLWLGGIFSLFLMWLISTPIAYFWIKNLEYIINEDRIRIHKGIITKTKQNIPFRAITDFALERTLFDRILGIGSIKIQTAGQSHSATGYEGKLAGLIEYEDRHSQLRERVKSLHPLSESITTAESSHRSDTDILKEILIELREIKKNTAKD